jgi:hypothetical protein
MTMQRNGMILVLSVGAFVAPSAFAQCGASMVPRQIVAWQALPTLALPGPRIEALQGKRAEARPGVATIVGLWKVVFNSGGTVVDQAFDAWHADGTETLVDTPPPSSGNVCIGVWAETGILTYKLNHPSWTFDEKGNLTGTATIKETISLDANGNTFIGAFSVDVADLNGKVLQHLTGTVSGQRITVD